MQKKNIILIVILLAVCVLVGIVFWLNSRFHFWSGIINPVPNNPSNTNNDFSRYLKPKVEPDNVTTITGSIIRILPDENKFIVRAESVRNVFLTDREFEVVFGTNTKISFTKLTGNTKGGVSFDQLQVGQSVIVVSANNAQTSQSLSAQEIYIMNGVANVMSSPQEITVFNPNKSQ